MEIPWDRLNPDTLRRVVEEFVSREGTDYGRDDVSLTQKVEQVLRQLQRKEAVLSFDEDSETCQVLPSTHFSRLRRPSSSPAADRSL